MSITTIRGSVGRTYDTLDKLKASTKVKAGDLVQTLGEASVNDGLGKEYIMYSSSQPDSIECPASGLWAVDFATGTSDHEERITDLEGDVAQNTSDIAVNETDIKVLQTTQGAGVVGYPTLAELNGDLGYPEGTVGYVLSDPTVENNGTYLKEGDVGSGKWNQGSDDLASQAYNNSLTNAASVTTNKKSINQLVDEKMDYLQDDINISTSEMWENTGTPKAQSTTFCGYTTALDRTNGLGDFDIIEIHIQLDAPAECSLTVMQSDHTTIGIQTYFDAVDGWNRVSLSRLVTASELGNVFYIGVNTVNRSFMTVNTITPQSGNYADTATYGVKGNRPQDPVDTYLTHASSQYRLPFRLYNSSAISDLYHGYVKGSSLQAPAILAQSMSSEMATETIGTLTGGYLNYGTAIGRGSAFLVPEYEFDTIRVLFRSESPSGFTVAMRSAGMEIIESLDFPEIRPAGDQALTIRLRQKYTKEILGDAVYVSFHSLDDASRIATPNITLAPDKYPTPTSAYPNKSRNPGSEDWIGVGSSETYRLYIEFGNVEAVAPYINRAIEIAATQEIQEVALPSKVHTISGSLNNYIYFGNIVEHPERGYSFSLKANNQGRHSEGSWQSRSSSVGTTNMVFTARDLNGLERAAKNSTLNVIAASTGSGQTPVMLCIGDSITQRGFYTQDILDIAAADVYKPTLIGSKGSDGNFHEGEGGKTVEWFATDVESPFVFSGVFNFTQYMTDKGFPSCDIVSFLLGSNDAGGLEDDLVLDTTIANAVAHYETMIASIKAYNPNAKIAISTPPQASADQDAYGIVYSDSRAAWQFRRNIQKFAVGMIQAFDFREDENIFISPVTAMIDTVNGYNVGDPVHPIDDGVGYEDIARTIFTTMKAQA